ncbi:hypothetical protein AGR8A_pTi10042 [Agrobacterium fabrum str. J-07]|nr:hypothetical protein AGR8A_pTi10042 [Agrobacterium fabrum str. J-07]
MFTNLCEGHNEVEFTVGIGKIFEITIPYEELSSARHGVDGTTGCRERFRRSRKNFDSPITLLNAVL